MADDLRPCNPYDVRQRYASSELAALVGGLVGGATGYFVARRSAYRDVWTMVGGLAGSAAGRAVIHVFQRPEGR